VRLHLRNGLGAELPSLRLILGTAGIALTASLALALSQPAVLAVDGQRVVSDVSPITTGNVAYLPLRAVTEAAGAETTFDAHTSRLTVRRGTEVLTMKLGDRNATLNGVAVQLKTAPFTVHGRAMVRGTDIALALASAVKYDAARGRIDVRTPGAVVAGVADDGQ
jgi:Copper amine oxidase N-terminal domain